MKSIAGIVLCAGQGSRMKSEHSKMLHPVAGVPLCCWPIGRVSSVVDNAVVAVIGYQGDNVQRVVRERFVSRVSFAWQPEQRGTGDAVKLALAEIPQNVSSILVAYGDMPLLREESLRALLQAQERCEAKVALFVAIHDSPTGYGRIIRDSNGFVIHIVEEVDADDEQRQIQEINSGIYVFDASFLRSQVNDLQDRNAKHEIYLTDLIAKARALYGAKSVVTCQISKEEILGINDRVQLSEAEGAMRRRLAHHWMKQGVTLIDPSTTYIDADVEISSDVTIHPNVILRGQTRIGKGSTILSHSVLEDAHIAMRVRVGPFARLRPGTVLEDDTHVGNFVELKKTHLRQGSKANHLAYLGDANIGENCNIGAGTITCNYDGFGKHLTQIGDGAFIGSNSTLVAPLTIGELSYVGAGSTVTKDVPGDALAISRAHQENKPGYAARIRERLKARAVKD